MEEGVKRADVWEDVWACDHLWERFDAQDEAVLETVVDAANEAACDSRGECIVVCHHCYARPVDVPMSMRRIEVNTGRCESIDLEKRAAWCQEGMKASIMWMRKTIKRNDIHGYWENGQARDETIKRLAQAEAEYMEWYGETV